MEFRIVFYIFSPVWQIVNKKAKLGSISYGFTRNATSYRRSGNTYNIFCMVTVLVSFIFKLLYNYYGC